MNDSFSEVMYTPAEWRLIVHPAMDGPMNMAIDEAIAEAVAAGKAPSTLRFYAWEPGCLSLGYAQPAADVLYEQLDAYGWDIVRRLTGGRAILHIDELTYSIVTPIDDPRVDGDVIESYRRLSAGLMTGLLALGAPVHAGKAEESVRRFNGPVCFEVPSDYEITSGGKKLLGSAQTRRGRVVLQHGALPLFGDITRIVNALVFESDAGREEARTRLLGRAITLEESLGRIATFDEVADALAGGLRDALCLDLRRGELSEGEQVRAEDLRASKYASVEWTERH